MRLSRVAATKLQLWSSATTQSIRRLDSRAHSCTTASHAPQSPANAAAIARTFGVTAVPAASLAAGQIQILLGAGAVLPGALAASQPQTPASVIPSTGPQGGAVIAPKDGIPCVN